MKYADIPATRLVNSFGYGASGAYIRTIPLTTADPNAASIELGFPPNTATPVGAGGKPPDIRDFNGILNETTGWTRWGNAGAPVPYNNAFATAIGGYPKGAMLASSTTAGTFYTSTVDDNIVDPEGAGTNWKTSILVDFGSAAYGSKSDSSLPYVPSMFGSIVIGHLAIWGNNGSSLVITDGGVYGSAANKTASDNSKAYVASVSGATVVGNLPTFSDTLGTIGDSGVALLNLLPAGSILWWPASAPPTGWLECNHASISTTTYARLFAVTGYLFGGSGASFNLPELRGYFIRGWSHGTGIDPARALGTVQADAFPSHTHDINFYSDNSGALGPGHGGAVPTGYTSTAAGSGVETRPLNVSLMPIIKY